MKKFTYDEFKKKIRESLRPKPAPLLPQQGSLFKRLLNRARMRRQGLK
jgi:hypothetical protein